MTSSILTLFDGLRLESSSNALLIGVFDFEIALAPSSVATTLSTDFISVSGAFDFAAVSSELNCLLVSSLATLLSVLAISLFEVMSLMATLLHVDVTVFRALFGAVSSTGVGGRLFFFADSFLTSVDFSSLLDSDASMTDAALFVDEI